MSLEHRSDPVRADWTIDGNVPSWALTALANCRVVVWVDASDQKHVALMGRNAAAPNNSGGAAEVFATAATANNSNLTVTTDPGGMMGSYVHVKGDELLALVVAGYQKHRTALRAVIEAIPALAAQVDTLVP